MTDVRKLPKEIQDKVYVPSRDGFIDDLELQRDKPGESIPPPTELDVEV